MNKRRLAKLESQLLPDNVKSKPNIDSPHSRIFDAVNDLAPRWRSRAGEAESDGKLPRETLEELFDARLMQILIPHHHGGIELDWMDMVEVSRIAARACASTGWVVAVVGAHAALASRLPQAMQQRIFKNGARQFIVTATPTETGLLTGDTEDLSISGRWQFCTGIDHATWIVARCFRPQEKVAGGRPTYLALLEPGQTTIRESSWSVMGMRATGSKDFDIASQRISMEMTVPLVDVLDASYACSNGKAVGYLYQVPIRPYFYSSLIGAILGCAEGAYDFYLEMTRTGISRGSTLAAKNVVHERLGESSARLACGESLYRSILDKLHTRGLAMRPLTQLEQAQLGRDRAYLARICVDAVQILVRQLGTRAMLEHNPLCRHWRDLQVMASHLDVNWDRGMQSYGEQVLLNSLDGSR